MATIVKSYDIPTKNDRQLQFASITLNVNGNQFTRATEISYEWTLDVGEARGLSPFPMGTTVGEYKCSGSITVQRIYREQFVEFIRQGSTGFADKVFNVEVTTQEFEVPNVETDFLQGCRLTGGSQDYSTGNAVLLTRFPLYIAIIYPNGRAPIQGIPDLRQTSLT